MLLKVGFDSLYPIKTGIAEPKNQEVIQTFICSKKKEPTQVHTTDVVVFVVSKHRPDFLMITAGCAIQIFNVTPAQRRYGDAFNRSG